MSAERSKSHDPGNNTSHAVRHAMPPTTSHAINPPLPPSLLPPACRSPAP